MGLYKKGSYNNNVNKNIQILNDSSYPDEENGNFILAGHSSNTIRNINKNNKKETKNIKQGG